MGRYPKSQGGRLTAAERRSARPDLAWRALVDAVVGLPAINGPGGVETMVAAANACAKLPFPLSVDSGSAGDGAGAAALAALALTYRRASDDARGYHEALLVAAAQYCSRRLDQIEAARLSLFRRAGGND